MKERYLSRVELNPRKRGTRQLLRSPQAIHAAVESAFPPSTTDPGARNLWRLDVSGTRHWLFVVSPRYPDFTHLIEQAGWVTGETQPWVTKRYDPFLRQLEPGQTWAFRFAGNPVRQGKASSGESKKYGHVTAQQQLEWFTSRAASHGFSLPKDPEGNDAVELVSRSDLRFRKKGGAAPVSIRMAVYEGVLEVQERELLRAALVQGIGRAKAYGCGLLTLAAFPGGGGS